jgi:hypothetical protein
MPQPPVLTIETIQNELTQLMKDYERLSQRRVEKGCTATLGLVMVCTSLAILIPRRPYFIAADWMSWPLLIGGLCIFQAAFRFWRRRSATLADLDRRLAALAAHVRTADRLELGSEDRTRLHSRLIECGHAVAESIVPILEVAGSKGSLDYLRSIAGGGPYSGVLPARSPELRRLAAEAADSLQKKLDRETDATTLLRSGGVAADSELLRPAANSAEDAPEVLLRPTDND